MLRDIYPYRKEMTVSERDCFPNLKMTPAALFILVQEVSGGHIAALGYDYKRLYEENIVFMLSSVSARILRDPVLGEKIIAHTCPAKSIGAHMMRETIIADEEDNVLAEFEASWIMADPKTLRILRPSSLPLELPTLKEYHPFNEVWNLRIPEEGDFMEERKVRLSDLDRNHHMNNTVYAKVICDLYPEDILAKGIEEISIKYKKQAVLGETLSLFSKKEGDTIIINAKKQDESLCFQGRVVLSK